MNKRMYVVYKLTVDEQGFRRIDYVTLAGTLSRKRSEALEIAYKDAKAICDSLYTDRTKAPLFQTMKASVRL